MASSTLHDSCAGSSSSGRNDAVIIMAVVAVDQLIEMLPYPQSTTPTSTHRRNPRSGRRRINGCRGDAMGGNIHPVASNLPAASSFNLKTMPPPPRWALIHIKQPPLLSHGAISRSRQRHVHRYGAEALGGNIVHVPSDLPAAYS